MKRLHFVPSTVIFPVGFMYSDLIVEHSIDMSFEVVDNEENSASRASTAYKLSLYQSISDCFVSYFNSDYKPTLHSIIGFSSLLTFSILSLSLDWIRYLRVKALHVRKVQCIPF